MPIPTGFCEVSYIHAAVGSTNPMVCVWGHNYPGDTVAGFTSVAHALNDIWGENMLLNMSDDISLQETVVRVGQDGAPTIQSYSGGSFAGGMSASMLPNNTASLIKKGTALGGRRGRGRCYLPPVGEEQAALGRLNSDIVTFLGVNTASWLNDLETVDLGPVLLHTGTGTLPPPSPVISLSVDPLLATQRRRLR